MKRYVVTLARWIASQAVKAEWKATGRKVEFEEVDDATAAYFREHQQQLLEEAWDHPVAKENRRQERMRLARKAIIAEIRERGGKVSSIAPEEIKKLIAAYMEEHPWEGCIETGCR
jgi:hypothetical protein